MKLCDECNLPMTEFDVKFEENLKKKTKNSTTSKKCFHCYTYPSGSYDAFNELEEAKKMRRRDLSLGIITVLLLLMSISVFIVAFILDKLEVEMNNYHIICMGGIVILFICFYRFASCYTTNRMHLIDDYDYSGTETRYVSKVDYDGAVVTTKEERCTGTSGSTIDEKKTWLRITYIFWCILRPLTVYSNKSSQLYKICPKEIISVYNRTKKEIKKTEISSLLIKYQERTIDLYNQKVEKVQLKYGIMGNSKVEKEISKIQKPPLKLFKKKYAIVKSFTAHKHPAYLMLYKNRIGEIVGAALLNGYFVCSTESSWRDVWLELLTDASVCNGETFSEYLDQAIERFKTYL